MKDYTNGPAPGFLTLWWHKGGLFALIPAVFTTFVTVVSYDALRQGLAYDARGVVAVATATDRRERTVRRDNKTDTDYFVTFEYEVPGSVVSIERKVGMGVYRALEPGQTRSIRYLPENPRQMEYTIGKTWHDGQIMRWVALVLGIVSLGAFWWTARPVVEALRARKYGEAVWAKVIKLDVNKTRTKRGTRTTYALVWQDDSGGTGRSLPDSTRTRFFRYGPTSDIEVYRDSRGKTWWVGDVGPRATAPTVPDAGKS